MTTGFSKLSQKHSSIYISYEDDESDLGFLASGKVVMKVIGFGKVGFVCGFGMCFEESVKGFDSSCNVGGWKIEVEGVIQVVEEEG